MICEYKLSFLHSIRSSMFHQLRWLNTVFDTCVLFTVVSKTLDPLVAKNDREQVNNTNVRVLIAELTYLPLPWQHD